MKFVVPVFVTQSPGSDPVYRVRPLFFSDPEVKGRQLDRVLSRLSTTLRRQLTGIANEKRLEELARYTFSPHLFEKSFPLQLSLKKGTVRGQFLVVVLPETEPRIAFFPQMPDLWFQLFRGQDLKCRAVEVLESYIQENGPPHESLLQGRSWISELDFHLGVPATPPKARDDIKMMILGGPPVKEGWQELEAVGRSLDDDYPHDLVRCLHRDRELGRLERALDGEARAPQLIVGERKVGKTALVHQLVRNYRQRRGNLKRRYWLLSPQRLISGMSYVGQWESRLLAILKHVRNKDLVLYFDDLIGLFTAGVCRDSDLSVADVLKSYLQRSQIRVVAETTHQGLALLRERDRGFADLFSLITLSETNERQTTEVVLEELRQSEETHRCLFELEALSTVIDLQRRYVRDAAFPGKAASFLARLAARRRQQVVTRQGVLEYFNSTSGMALELLDDAVVLKREQVLERLKRRVVGQEAATEVAADAVMLTKARLGEPRGRISSLLFVGSTGVGKTECAKALAELLFGSEERLLRFDMNEFVNPSAASRLVGTFHDPEGLLTSVVRQRPFSVILFDEIEKAHFEVFNLLLQVLGDGRLTDARGRTVDFTQTIIILTSNLGVAEASRPLGFRSKAREENLVYRRAVEEFFPPEFFNRLDQVVPFVRLTRDHTAAIAQAIINKVLRREGLVRRQCLLDVSDQAMERIVDMGYHPQLGARALKRSIERSIAGPVAAQLSQMPPHAPTLVKVRGDSTLEVEVAELLPPASSAWEPPWQEPGPYLDDVEKELTGLEAGLESPEGLVGEEMTGEQLLYFETSDRLRRARAIVRRLRGMARGPSKAPRRFEGGKLPLLLAPNWQRVFQSSNLQAAFKEIALELPAQTADILLQAKFAELLAEMAFLRAPGDSERETWLELRWNSAASPSAHWLRDVYRAMLKDLDFEVQCRELEGEGCRLDFKGLHSGLLSQGEHGLHLFQTGEGLALVEVRAMGQEPPSRVSRLYDEKSGVLDLRTGWMVQGLPSSSTMAELVLTGVRTLQAGGGEVPI